MPFRQLSLWLLLYGNTFIPKTDFRTFTSLNVFFLILEVWVYPFLSLKHLVSCLSLNVSLMRAKDPSTFPVSHSLGGIRHCDIPGRSVIFRQTFLAHTCTREDEWPCLIWTVLYPKWKHVKMDEVINPALMWSWRSLEEQRNTVLKAYAQVQACTQRRFTSNVIVNKGKGRGARGRRADYHPQLCCIFDVPSLLSLLCS